MKYLIILLLISSSITYSHDNHTLTPTGEWSLFYFGGQVGYYAIKFDNNYLEVANGDNYDNQIIPSLKFEYIPSNLKHYSFVINISYFNRERDLVHGIPQPGTDFDSFQFRDKEKSSYLLYDLNAKYRLYSALNKNNLYITGGLYNTINFNRKYQNRGEITSYTGNENKFDFGYCMGLGYEYNKNDKLRFNLEYKFYDRFVENINQSNIYPLWTVIHFGGVSVMYSL